MNKFIIGLALAVGISTAANAIDYTVATDTTYNIDQETTATEFGVTASHEGIELSLLPTLSWDDSKISDIELSAGYTITVFDTVDVTPYGEIHFNDSFATGDKIIGFKTSYKF